MKKRYAAPMVIASDVVRSTEIGVIYRTWFETFTRYTEIL